jgi:polar amino acid transport system permease protein
MLSSVASGILNTVLITVSSFIIGSVLALPLVAARVSRYAALRTIAALVVDSLRAIPPIVLLFIIYYGIAQGYLRLSAYDSGVACLSLVSAGFMAEVFRSSLRAISKGQREAARALGLGRIQVVMSVVSPQAARIAVPSGAAWAIGLLKDSSVVSLVGVQDVTFRAFTEAQSGSSGTLPFIYAGGIYLLLSVPIGLLARYTGAKLAKGVRW